MKVRRAAAVLVALAGPPVLFILATMPAAQAHGSMQNPVSRTYACYLEGPESPDSAACIAAIAAGGTQPLYDWNEVHILDAAGRHRDIIPDGKLCSAGQDKYRGFDLARADWPATTLPTGGSYTFSYRATAPHRGTFELYVTKTGYSPTQPLRWSDLEATPFLRVTDPPLANGAYTMTGQLPAGKSGRHLIYSIWQRSDSPEAFYTCSDVLFGGGGPTPSPSATPSPTPSATPTPTASPTPSTTNTPPGSYPAWQPNTAYATGARVSYGSVNYQCLQAHTSLTGWEPPNVPALWRPLG
jgi:predicted carbohydrate-binding protein with CBM5 and CBM33 domain